MTKEEQTELLQNLAAAIVKDMTKAIRDGKVPESWDGLSAPLVDGIA